MHICLRWIDLEGFENIFPGLIPFLRLVSWNHLTISWSKVLDKWFNLGPAARWERKNTQKKEEGGTLTPDRLAQIFK